MIPTLDMKAFGFGEVAQTFLSAGVKLLQAREYALASTAKLIRNALKSAARGKGASGFESNELGWNRLSPFTGIISKAKSQGGSRENYRWATDQVKDFGKGGADATRQYFFSDVGKRRQAQLRSELEAAHGSFRKPSKDGKFIGANREAIQKAKKDERWAGYLTAGRTKALKRAINTKASRDSWVAWRKSMSKLVSRDPSANKERAAIKMGSSGRSQPLAHLINFVRSRIDTVKGVLTVGFFRDQGAGEPDGKIESLVRQQAQGYTVSITGAMRRFLFAIGAPTSKTTFTVAPRPWFVPVWAKVKEAAIANFQNKFLGRFLPTLQRLGDQVFLKEAA